MTRAPFNAMQRLQNPHSIDDLLMLVEARGLKLANLFQFEVAATGTWRWQANITDGSKYWDFARGATAAEALRAALFTAATTEPAVDPRPGPTTPGPANAVEPDDQKPITSLGF